MEITPSLTSLFPSRNGRSSTPASTKWVWRRPVRAWTFEPPPLPAASSPPQREDAHGPPRCGFRVAELPQPPEKYPIVNPLIYCYRRHWEVLGVFTDTLQVRCGGFRHRVGVADCFDSIAVRALTTAPKFRWYRPPAVCRSATSECSTPSSRASGQRIMALAFGTLRDGSAAS
jgi:hypothetical protein